MNERERPVFNIGITLVILIFMNLCLIVFSILSLQNAVSDQKLTNKTADYTTAYYDACNDIEENWEKISEELKTIHSTAKSEKEFDQLIKKKYRDGSCQASEENGELYLYCSSPVLEHQKLCGRAKILWNKRENGQYMEVMEYQLEDNGTWNADQSINVYQGN